MLSLMCVVPALLFFLKFWTLLMKFWKPGTSFVTFDSWSRLLNVMPSPLNLLWDKLHHIIYQIVVWYRHHCACVWKLLPDRGNNLSILNLIWTAVCLYSKVKLSFCLFSGYITISKLPVDYSLDVTIHCLRYTLPTLNVFKQISVTTTFNFTDI